MSAREDLYNGSPDRDGQGDGSSAPGGPSHPTPCIWPRCEDDAVAPFDYCDEHGELAQALREDFWSDDCWEEP